MFQVYKRGQGTTARWISAISLGAMAAYGCYDFLGYLNSLTDVEIPLGMFSLRLGTFIAGITFLGAVVLVAWLVNLPKFVDYLIMSEVELRKVSWPTRDELKRQTLVVIIALVAFAVVLYLTDLIVGWGVHGIYSL